MQDHARDVPTSFPPRSVLVMTDGPCINRFMVVVGGAGVGDVVLCPIVGCGTHTVTEVAELLDVADRMAAAGGGARP